MIDAIGAHLQSLEILKEVANRPAAVEVVVAQTEQLAQGIQFAGGVAIEFAGMELAESVEQLGLNDKPKYNLGEPKIVTQDVSQSGSFEVTTSNDGEGSVWKNGSFIRVNITDEKEILSIAIAEGAVDADTTAEEFARMGNDLVVSIVVPGGGVHKVAILMDTEGVSYKEINQRVSVDEALRSLADQGVDLSSIDPTALQIHLQQIGAGGGSLKFDSIAVKETPATTTTTSTPSTTVPSPTTTVAAPTTTTTIPEERGDEHMLTTTVPVVIATQPPVERDVPVPVTGLAETGARETGLQVFAAGVLLAAGGRLVQLSRSRRRKADLAK